MNIINLVDVFWIYYNCDIFSVLLHLAVHTNGKIVLLLPLKMSSKAPVTSKSLSTDCQIHRQKTRNLLIRWRNVQKQKVSPWHSMGKIALVKQNMIFQGNTVLPVRVGLWKGGPQNTWTPTVHIKFLGDQRRRLKAA